MSNLVKRVQNFVFAHKLFKKGFKIVVGVSGGPDSVCLVNIMAKLQHSYDLELHMAHVNYGMRDKDSDRDEILVRNISETLGIPLSVLNAKNLYNNSSGNLENKLRDIRYEFFEEQRTKMGYDAIAVAHTIDDQAETVLMRLLRGAGSLGMAAIRFKQGNIIRPLLEVSKKDVLTFLRQNDIAYRIDKSNENVKIIRNSIRIELIPLLEQKYNPSVKETLCANARIMADDYAELERLFFKKSGRYIQKKGADIFFSSAQISMQSHSFQRYLIRRSIEMARGSLRNISEGNIAEALKVVHSGKNKNKEIAFKGLKIEKKGDTVRVGLN